MDYLKDLDFADAKEMVATFMSKHGQTDLLPAGSYYVTDGLDGLPLKIVPDESASYTRYRLKVEDEDADEDKEVILYTVGVLTQKLLPPFKPKRRYNPQRDSVFKGFRQSISIHGAGADATIKAIECAKLGFVLLERHVAKPAAFPSERVCLDNFTIANPYFETGEDAKGKEMVKFSALVDPFGDLNHHQTDGCTHTADNEVQYLEGFEDDDGTFKHGPVSPSRFRPGDIVRAGFTISIRQDNAYTATASEFELVLRSVTLIDDTISTAIAMKELDAPPQTGKKRAAVSRGALVEDARDRPIAKVRKAMAKLSIRSTAMDIDKAGNGNTGTP
ncbi:hypothetical protein K525DRAFT_274063 [Schizophyllum commune Loenen D]|nr:hypothetical protein K525DRAFT_274063 [Schizophyllum commune Loenen D]